MLRTPTLLTLLLPSSALAVTDATDTDQPDGVVGIEAAGEVYCSGTLIADTWVLTEYICLQSYHDLAGIGASHILIGDDPTTAVSVEVANVYAHPDAAKLEAAYTNDPRRIALFELAAPAGATPLPLSARNDADLTVGETLRLNGWGISADNQSDHHHREGTADISALDPGVVYTSGVSNWCYADAGGPLLDSAGEVVGIGAFVFPLCVGGDGGSWSLEQTRDWIEATSGVTAAVDTGLDTGLDTGTLPTDTGTGVQPPDTATDTGSGPSDPGTTPTGPTPSTDTGDEGGDTTDDGSDEEDKGCGCQTSGSPGVGVLLAGLLLGWRRRRRNG